MWPEANAFMNAFMDTIYHRIPHRPPFLFIDRMLEIREDGAVAERLVRAEEPHFAGHYPGNPIMPGVLLCEAIFQCAAVYMAHRLETDPVEGNTKTPVLARIIEAKFKQIVRPGDVLRIEVHYKEALSRFHFLRGKALVGGKAAVSVEFALALLDT